MCTDKVNTLYAPPPSGREAEWNATDTATATTASQELDAFLKVGNRYCTSDIDHSNLIQGGTLHGRSHKDYHGINVVLLMRINRVIKPHL